MPSAISVVTLLTDFGERDYFVASMKGVILGINTQARVVDISHTITPHAIDEAAFLLNACYHYFPDGTVHVVVVDPGVGSSRRRLLVTTSRYFFVAPDNGVLTSVIEHEHAVEVRQIENRQLCLDAEGATFDGRDVFAPSAAWLTRGHTPGAYGRLVSDYHRLQIPKPEIRDGALHGRVVSIDHFGNLITDITPADLAAWQTWKAEQAGSRASGRQDMTLTVGGATIDSLKTHYAQGSPDKPDALINSIGYLEVFMKETHAAHALRVTTGTAVVLQ